MKERIYVVPFTCVSLIEIPARINPYFIDYQKKEQYCLFIKLTVTYLKYYIFECLNSRSNTGTGTGTGTGTQFGGNKQG